MTCIHALSVLGSVLALFVCLFLVSMHVSQPIKKVGLWKELIS